MSNYKKIKDIGNIGYNKKLKIMKWYDKEAKYDLRVWDNRGTPRQGITFSKEELAELKDIVERILEEEEK